jgi:hypothetical protein
MPEMKALAFPRRIVGALKRAFSQFLAVPLAVVLGFVLMTAAIYWADTSWSQGRVPPGFGWLGALLGDSGSLATLLSTVASSIITVTSIIFSLLLIALQQGSSALTPQVTDQFLMRRVNQFYFGYFIGLSVFVLLSLVTASGIHRPVFGTAAALVLTTVALCMIVVMIYNTIDQMRPKQIVRAIHRHVLAARDSQLALLRSTRRDPRLGWPTVADVRATEAGHIVAVDAEALRRQLGDVEPLEVELLVPLGRYVAFGDRFAVLRAPAGRAPVAASLAAAEAAVLAAVAFDDDRDLKRDAAYGIFQLATIGWTTGSTSKSNPEPVMAVIQSLRDILARWFTEGPVAGDPGSMLVIADAAPGEALDALENLILVSSESMQAQTLAEALRTAAALLAAAPEPWIGRLADVVRRALASLGEHVLTRDLEEALEAVALALSDRHLSEPEHAVRVATKRFASTLGELNSRSTRVPGQG